MAIFKDQNGRFHQFAKIAEKRRDANQAKNNNKKNFEENQEEMNNKKIHIQGLKNKLDEYEDVYKLLEFRDFVSYLIKESLIVRKMLLLKDNNEDI